MRPTGAMTVLLICCTQHPRLYLAGLQRASSIICGGICLTRMPLAAALPQTRPIDDVLTPCGCLQAGKKGDLDRKKQRRLKRGSELPEEALADPEAPLTEPPAAIAVQQGSAHNDTDSSSGTTISTPTRREAARPSPLAPSISGHEADDETDEPPAPSLPGSRGSGNMAAPRSPTKVSMLHHAAQACRHASRACGRLLCGATPRPLPSVVLLHRSA